MLTMRFTAEDLARVRIAPEPDPMWEIVLSLRLLRNQEGTLVFDDWRRRTRRRLDPSVRMLFPLSAPNGRFASFLVTSEGAVDVEEGIAAVLASSPARLRARLGAALRTYYNGVLAPEWSTVRAYVAADRAIRARALLEGGSEAMLAGLRPLLRWRSGRLELDHPVDRELCLDGRGVRLVPAFFCWRQPVALLDPAFPPVLVYPVEHNVPNGGERPAGVERDRSLGSLLGRTRAAVLRTLEDTSTTTELARRLDVSPASASQHTAVLREAGLISTRRQGSRVLHALTPLGIALLGSTTKERQTPADTAKGRPRPTSGRTV